MAFALYLSVLLRDSSPRYRMLLRNQTDSGEGDFVQAIDDKIKFEVKEGTFFYQYVSVVLCVHVLGLAIMVLYVVFGFTTKDLCLNLLPN